MMISGLLLFVSVHTALALPGDSAPWESLSSKPVMVECATVGDAPWCRSEGVIEAPVEQVVDALKNMRYNAGLFEAVLEIHVLSEDVLHVVLDYPAPLDDRDYVAKYAYSTEGDAHLFQWEPSSLAGAPGAAEAVRLPNFAGEWRLEARGAGTWVRYTWQAEINGKFPSFAYGQAWKKAGHEALKDLANTQKASLSAP